MTYHWPPGPSNRVPCPRECQGWAASVQRRSGLAGMFCQGPWMERERATMIMCPVAGPAVPPTAETR